MKILTHASHSLTNKLNQLKKTSLWGCLLCVGIMQSCTTTVTRTDPDSARKEVARAEADFARMAAEKGIAEAFATFADSNAVIKRKNDSLIVGKAGIRNFYSNDFYKAASVSWSPDFIEVSSSGDLAYTYGTYTWKSTDTSGHPIELKGIFHTVWKKQADGTWKYVWD